MEFKKIFEKYKQYLADKDLAVLTITGYLSDLRIFAQWFQVRWIRLFRVEKGLA